MQNQTLSRSGIRPFVLIVLDGWGHREEITDNAIAQAKTSFYDSLLKQYPHTLLDASQESVGLPTGQMGNSEIGHMTIGAGTVIDTDLVKIAKAIRNNEFGTNPAFVQLFQHVKKYDSYLHVMGLLSNGGVHSHEDHLHAFLRAAKEARVNKIVIHAFTDGRDTAPQSAAENLKRLEDILADLGIGRIATVSGRFYAMDRDHNWDRVAKFEEVAFGTAEDTVSPTKLVHQSKLKSPYKQIVQGQKPSTVVNALYRQGTLDEHIEPLLFLDENGMATQISDNDGVFFFNFRADRAKQLAEKISVRAADHNLLLVTMTQYDDASPAVIAFPKAKIEKTLAAEISKAGLRQAHIAETEKYAHATYFLNGGRQEPHVGEEHILVPSRKDIATHDLAPKMRAEQIADKAIEQLDQGTQFIFINFANADMVGHTANVAAIKIAVEEVDLQLSRVVQKALEKHGAVFVTADHGNAEMNVDSVSGTAHTAHTTNLVPAIITIEGLSLKEHRNLSDVAPTVLSLMGLPIPSQMTGQTIVV